MDIFVGTQPLIYRALVRGDNYRDQGTVEVSEIRLKTITSGRRESLTTSDNHTAVQLRKTALNSGVNVGVITSGYLFQPLMTPFLASKWLRERKCIK